MTLKELEAKLIKQEEFIKDLIEKVEFMMNYIEEQIKPVEHDELDDRYFKEMCDYYHWEVRDGKIIHLDEEDEDNVNEGWI